MKPNSAQKEQRRLTFSLVMVVLLMIWGLVFNELTESNIVELDAGAYIISGLIGIVTIYVSKLQRKPGDENHPLGFSGFIPILNLIRSFMIILICLKGIGESIGSIASGPAPTDHKILFIYSMVTLFFNTASWIYLSKSAQKLNSELLQTDALEWKIDTVFNIAILAAIMVSYYLQQHGQSVYANYVDPVFCIILSFWMSFSPSKLFMDNLKKLSLRSASDNIQQEIIDRFVAELPEINAFDPRFVAIDFAGTLWVEIQLNISDENKISSSSIMGMETKGASILNEINPNHHLTFRFK